MVKRALVISGGGSKGAFAVGVIKQLLGDFPGLKFDIFVGTSTGSLIIPLAALGELNRLEMLYTSKTTKDIINVHNIGDRLGEHSVYDANPLWNLITGEMTDTDYQRIVDQQINLGFTTTCLQSGELTVFNTRNSLAEPRHYEQVLLQNAEHFRRAVLASACQPVFMPPVKVNRAVQGAPNPDWQYVDGGVREYAGIQMAIDQGATEIFTILLSSGSVSPLQSEFKDLLSILLQTIDIFTDDVGKNDLIVPGQYNEALEYIEAVKNKMRRAGISSDDINSWFTVRGRENPYEDKIPLKLFTIRPDGPLGGGPGGLTFDPAEMKGMLAAGKQKLTDYIASLDPSDISWA